MLDHVSLGVKNLERSRRFYDAALRPLGLVRTVDFQGRGSDYGAMAGQCITTAGNARMLPCAQPRKHAVSVLFLAPDALGRQPGRRGGQNRLFALAKGVVQERAFLYSRE